MEIIVRKVYKGSEYVVHVTSNVIITFDTREDAFDFVLHHLVKLGKIGE